MISKKRSPNLTYQQSSAPLHWHVTTKLLDHVDGAMSVIIGTPFPHPPQGGQQTEQNYNRRQTQYRLHLIVVRILTSLY